MYPHFDAVTWATPFGLLFLTAIFIAWYFARRNAIGVNVDPSHVDLLIPIAIIVGVAFGTLLALFAPMDEGIRVSLFAIVGAGAFAVLVYSRIAGLPFLRVLDLFALPTIAALMVHRIGCFLAGCCWGKPAGGGLPATTAQFPPGSFAYNQHLDAGLIPPNALTSLPVHAVQLYEAGLLLVLLPILWRLSWRRFPTGTITIISICSYAFVRFFMEYLRADGSIVLGSLTSTQVICIVLLLGTALLPLRKSVSLRQ